MSATIRRATYWDGELWRGDNFPTSGTTAEDARALNRRDCPHLVAEGDADVYEFTIHIQGEVTHIREVYTYESSEVGL